MKARRQLLDHPLLLIRTDDSELLRRGKLLVLTILLILVACVLNFVLDTVRYFLLVDFQYKRFTLITMAFAASLVVLFFLARRGFVMFSASVFVLILTLVLTFGFAALDLEGLLFLYSIPVLAASFIVFPWFSFPTALLCTGCYAFVHFFANPGAPFNYPFVIFLNMAAVMAWIASGILGKAIRSADEKASEAQANSMASSASNERFRQLTDVINEVFWITELANDNVLYLSPAFERIWNLKRQDIYSDPRSWLLSVHEDDRDTVRHKLDSHGSGDSWEMEYQIRASDSKTRWLRDCFYPVRDAGGKVYRQVRVTEDITHAKMAEQELLYIAYHDSLTGLKNRKAFYEAIEDTLVQAERAGAANLRGLFLMDLFNYRDINDSYGHRIGDRLLVALSQRLKNSLRKSDLVFRLFGDEFAILLTSFKKIDDLGRVVQKVIESLSRPYKIEEHEIILSVNIGIAHYPADGTSSTELVKNADLALIEARKEPNSSSFFSREMTQRVHRRFETEKKLRSAMNRDAIELFYQPVVDIRGVLTGCEALARWNENGSSISPSVFIPIAEDSGLIVPLGEQLFHKACISLAAWRAEGHMLRMSFNVSPRQLKHKDFWTKIEDALSIYGLPPDAIELEITEGCFLEEPEKTGEKLTRMAERGLRFSIDDFGTGYSSLSYIRRLPIHTIKIDQSFIREIESDADSQEIVRAIIAMSHNLRLDVVAEGVETLKQWDFLSVLECDRMQGYYFTRPIPADEFRLILGRKSLP